MEVLSHTVSLQLANAKTAMGRREEQLFFLYIIIIILILLIIRMVKPKFDIYE
jgi:hypothetical protein